MKSQDIAVYREIQRNTEMAMKAIDTISDKVYDDQLAMQIARQSIKYSEIHNQAMKQLVAAKGDAYRSNYISDMMLKAGIHYNTFLNTSTGHIAEMMVKGSNMGVLEMEKILNHNEQAGERSVGLARELIEFEEKNVERLMKFL